MKEKYCSGYAWDKGNRDRNQDAVCLRQIRCGRSTVLLAAVCDGVGGLKMGETASTYTVSALAEYLDEILLQTVNYYFPLNIRKRMNRKLYELHQSMIRFANEEKIQMGTTLDVAVIYRKRYHLFHIGDGRGYLLYQNRVKTLTKDDVNREYPGQLLHALGVGKWKIPEYKSGRIHRGQSLLLCSDGFYRRNERILQKSPDSLKCIREDEKMNDYLKTMVRRAATTGEQDNSSAICIRRL